MLNMTGSFIFDASLFLKWGLWQVGLERQLYLYDLLKLIWIKQCTFTICQCDPDIFKKGDPTSLEFRN